MSTSTVKRLLEPLEQSRRSGHQPGVEQREQELRVVDLELGVAPGYAGTKASFAVPVKFGLSLSDYYEFGGEDEKFGYFSIGGIVTVPLGAHLNIHGGGEFQTFGDSVSDYNDQDTAGIFSIGLGFAF